MKFGLCVFAIMVTVCLVRNVVGLPKPRDGTLVISEDLPVNSVALEKQGNEDSKVSDPNEASIPGRVWCQHKEVTEDEDCQGHCIPKGYSYGLCVSNMCTCI